MDSTAAFEISRGDLQKLNIPDSAFITDVKSLSSYNWLEAPESTPTIAVPGCPPLWLTPTISRNLKKDSGLVYIAQNVARHPESPLEPLFRALYVTQPSFDICSIDVVTDRNNIRKLLSFIDPSPLRNGLEEFTIGIEVTKDTAILCRKEDKTAEYIGPNEFRGFGHEFEKAYTVNQIQGSTGHHRIIAYCFSDLNFIVRHETDGYTNTNAGTVSSQANETTQDNISSILGALSLAPDEKARLTRSKLIIKEKGKMIPLESTLELKTRVFHKPLKNEEIIPQLWVSQTPKVVRAYHRNGSFQVPQVEDFSGKIKNWEVQNQDHLKNLAALIKKIINLAKECGGKAVLKYDVTGDKLVISKVERKEMLPNDLYAKWNDVCNLPEETDPQTVGIKEAENTQPGENSISTVIKAGDDPKTAIRIGDIDYHIDLSKIPYLESFVQLQKTTQPQVTKLTHESINLFDVALKGVECGYRQCFRCLPIDLSQYRALFQTYDFLKINLLGNLSTDQVIAYLKAGRASYDDEGERVYGQKAISRDAAFQFLYLIMHPESRDGATDCTKLFHAVLFVVSHSATFKYSTRRIIRLAYEEQCSVTIKQSVRLDLWEQGETSDDEEDTTTDDESEYYYSSDYDYYSDSD